MCFLEIKLGMLIRPSVKRQPGCLVRTTPLTASLNMDEEVSQASQRRGKPGDGGQEIIEIPAGLGAP